MKRIFFLILVLTLNSAMANQHRKEDRTISSDNILTMSPDSEILAMLIAVNVHEIKAAETALTKNPSNQVKKYAKMMIKDHKENLKKTKMISKKIKANPTETEKVAEMKMKGAKELTLLSTKENKNFEQEYIQAMIDGHTEVLTKIDENFLPNAANLNLKKHLSATRDAVAHHLKRAKEVKESL